LCRLNTSKKIIWLASYPKSGNTWFRIFLSNLIRDSKEPVSINDIERTTIASSRTLFDEYSAIPSSELSHEEIDLLRPTIYKEFSKKSEGIIFQKVHDAFNYLKNGMELFPEEITKGAIYFIRNPLDVAVSFAHHNNISFEKMISQMNNSNYSFCGKNDRLHGQIRQQLLSWSEHVKSWNEKPNFPVYLIRYEDMKDNTFKIFKEALEFIGLEKNDEQIKRAINNSQFDKLRTMEERSGFNEKPLEAEMFFRKGEVGTWKQELSRDEIEKIKASNANIMKKFGY